MSFSSDIKQCLCETGYDCPECRTAELAGVFVFTGRLDTQTPRFYSSSEAVTERVRKALSEEFGADAADGDRIVIGDGDLLLLMRRKLIGYKPRRQCCVRAYVRGAFLGGGSVSDPKREYHMEFDTRSEQGALELIEMLGELGVKAKKTVRKGREIVYIKESGNIADVLGYMSDGRAGLEILSAQVEKEMKNSIVRQVNCDSANLNKQARASSRQIAAIKKIKAARKWQSMPEVLREMGELRLRYPDISMEELGKMTGQGIGKSGVNHRLSRIIEYAESLSTKAKEEKKL